jgi:hypothetical protein
MLQTGALYNDLGGAYFTRQTPTAFPNASSELQALGHNVTNPPGRSLPDGDFA